MKPKTLMFYSDMSLDSDHVFPLTIELAAAQRAQKLYIVHVLHSPYRFRGDIVDPGLAMGLNPEIIDVAEKALRDRYEPALRGYAGASFHVLHGVAGVEILRFVRKHAVGQIVLAKSVAQKELPQGPGSLERFLIERCPCPLLFVMAGRHPASLSGGSAPDSGPQRERSKVIDLERYRIRRAGCSCEGVVR